MTVVRWLDDDEAVAWRSWVALSARVHVAVGRDLARDHRLSEPEYAVLANLSEAPERRVRMSDLATLLEWSPSRLSHLVGRMETKGLVARQECPEDARGSFAALTERGFATITRAAPDHVASVRRHFLDLLDRDQILQLGTLASAALARMGPGAATCPGVPADPATVGGDGEASDCHGFDGPTQAFPG